MRRLVPTALAAGLSFAVPGAAAAAELVCHIQQQDRGFLSTTGETNSTNPLGDWVFDVNNDIPDVAIVSGRRDTPERMLQLDGAYDVRVTDDEISFCMSSQGCDVMVGGSSSQAKASRTRIDRRTGLLTMTVFWQFQYTADVFGHTTLLYSGPCSKKAPPPPQKF